jgi:DNA ligase (NAD+)
MTKNQAEKRIIKLRQLIDDYRYHYHVLDESIMSEAAADSLKHELSLIETEFPELITADSPTQRVAGSPLPGFSQVEHSSRMLSLNDVFNEQELESWKDRISRLLPENQQLEYFVDIKMDGLACALLYDDGLLKAGVTRGNGLIGEDVTSNIRTIDSLPLSLRKDKNYQELLVGRTEVRGEIVMYKADFKRLNEDRAREGKPLFANPRNTAAGTIRQLDARLVMSRPLHFRAYDLLRLGSDDMSTNKETYQALSSLGFLVNKQSIVTRDRKDILTFAASGATKRSPAI